MKSLAFVAVFYGVMWFFIGLAMLANQEHRIGLSIFTALIAMCCLVLSVYFAADFFANYWVIPWHDESHVATTP